MIKKITSFFSRSDFESVIAEHLTSTILSFDFYQKVVYFGCKFGLHDTPLLTFQTDRLDLRGLELGKSGVIYSLA